MIKTKMVNSNQEVMKLKDIVSQLANRIHQLHVIEANLTNNQKRII